jgi:hypothetical protein
MVAKVCRLIFTDGRKDYLSQTFKSFQEKMIADFATTFIVDDSGDPGTYGEWLEKEFGPYVSGIFHHPQRLGYCRSIKLSWSGLPDDYTHIMHLEDDFILEREVRLDEILYVLDHNPNLCQIWLMRHPWYEVEKQAGSVYLNHGSIRWKEGFMEGPEWQRLRWTEERGQYWTSNPCVYPRKIVDLGWPDPPLCEQAFRAKLGNLRSAFWGSACDPPYTRHIGAHTDNRSLTIPVDMRAMVKGF